ncbi:hypothetical protein LMT8_00400 [Leuconostoc mesenteroides subsp. cremoris TIFN8]|nr:hypothetical protein LMT8_00400 [Leuconostoc mesenteroides subsp. cremoris TIFN8]
MRILSALKINLVPITTGAIGSPVDKKIRLAEEFGPSKDSIALWVKQLEKRLAILEEENEILSRIA